MLMARPSLLDLDFILDRLEEERVRVRWAGSTLIARMPIGEPRPLVERLLARLDELLFLYPYELPKLIRARENK